MKKFAYDLLSWLEDGAGGPEAVGLDGVGFDFENDIRVCRYVLDLEVCVPGPIEFLSEPSENQLLLRRDLQE